VEICGVRGEFAWINGWYNEAARDQHPIYMRADERGKVNIIKKMSCWQVELIREDPNTCKVSIQICMVSVQILGDPYPGGKFDPNFRWRWGNKRSAPDGELCAVPSWAVLNCETNKFQWQQSARVSTITPAKDQGPREVCQITIQEGIAMRHKQDDKHGKHRQELEPAESKRQKTEESSQKDRPTTAVVGAARGSGVGVVASGVEAPRAAKNSASRGALTKVTDMIDSGAAYCKSLIGSCRAPQSVPEGNHVIDADMPPLCAISHLQPQEPLRRVRLHVEQHLSGRLEQDRHRPQQAMTATDVKIRELQQEISCLQSDKEKLRQDNRRLNDTMNEWRAARSEAVPSNDNLKSKFPFKSAIIRDYKTIISNDAQNLFDPCLDAKDTEWAREASWEIFKMCQDLVQAHILDPQKDFKSKTLVVDVEGTNQVSEWEATRVSMTKLQRATLMRISANVKDDIRATVLGVVMERSLGKLKSHASAPNLEKFVNKLGKVSFV